MNREVVKKYFSMHKALLKEKQFSKKVELNSSISRYKKEHKISVIGSEPMNEVMVDGLVVGKVIWKYAKKDRNLECKHIGYNYKITI